MERAWASDSSLPTQSITTSAPPVSVPRRLERARAGVAPPAPAARGRPPRRRRAPRPGAAGARTLAPTSSWPGPRPAGAWRPRWQGPRCPPRARPRCAPGSSRAATTACTAQAVGSTITASSSESSSGTACSWASMSHEAGRATTRRRCRCRTRSAGPGRGGRRRRARTRRCGPRHTPRTAGSMARATHPRTGSITTRAAASSRVAHHLVAGDEGEAHDVLEVAGAAPVEGGQVRAADARQEWSHPVPAAARAARAARRR